MTVASRLFDGLCVAMSDDCAAADPSAFPMRPSTGTVVTLAGMFSLGITGVVPSFNVTNRGFGNKQGV